MELELFTRMELIASSKALLVSEAFIPLLKTSFTLRTDDDKTATYDFTTILLHTLLHIGSDR